MIEDTFALLNRSSSSSSVDSSESSFGPALGLSFSLILSPITSNNVFCPSSSLLDDASSSSLCAVAAADDFTAYVNHLLALVG